MRLVWDEAAWADCKHWQTADRKMRKRINTLIDACLVGRPALTFADRARDNVEEFR
ncbi:type II toxin-antitoxin system YoeB family toxin [Brevibacterium linens]|uniref:type II toxin-antitoxin system YoeB family toxin n=1 Tax=Brevibacterium linens TaxID=1703 RepID=UPI003F8A6027